MKKTMTIVVVALFCSCLGLISGCNTVKGFGKDVSSGGRDIEKAAS